MFKEIFTEAKTRETELMKKNLIKALNKEKITYVNDPKIMHLSVKISSNISIGIASEFHDEYTVYDSGVEKLNSADIGKILDYIKD